MASWAAYGMAECLLKLSKLVLEMGLKPWQRQKKARRHNFVVSGQNGLPGFKNGLRAI